MEGNGRKLDLTNNPVNRRRRVAKNNQTSRDEFVLKRSDKLICIRLLPMLAVF
jgi:hypothetical protein